RSSAGALVAKRARQKLRPPHKESSWERMPAPIPWFLNAPYSALLAALSPGVLWRVRGRGKYRPGWREKLLGQVPRRAADRPCLWFHAVSVGEVLQLEPVMKELRVRLPAVEFVISTTTPTGRSVAEAKFPRDSV